MRLRTAKKLKKGDVLYFKESWMGTGSQIVACVTPSRNFLVEVTGEETRCLREYNYRHFKEPENAQGDA